MGEESLMGKEVNVIFRLEKLAGSLGDLLFACSLGEHELKGFERKRLFFSA